MKLPKARTENLLEQNLKGETLIYDLTIDKALNLNETLTVVYQACSQKMTFEELRRKHRFPDDFIYLALDELRRNNLLAELFDSPFETTNRREVIRRVGLATMLALPVITGLIAPKSANAASGAASGAGAQGRGGYDQQCIAGDFGASCNGDLRCVPTRSGQDRCCEYSRATGTRYYSGEGDTQINFPIPKHPEDEVNSDNDSCQYNLACCDGRAATGRCTYTPDNRSEYSEKDYEGFRESGQYPYIQTCTCTCP